MKKSVILHGVSSVAGARLPRRDVRCRSWGQENTEMRFRPEIALTRLQLAELLLEHYPGERAEAMQHLDFAIGEYREILRA